MERENDHGYSIDMMTVRVMVCYQTLGAAQYRVSFSCLIMMEKDYSMDVMTAREMITRNDCDCISSDADDDSDNDGHTLLFMLGSPQKTNCGPKSTT